MDIITAAILVTLAFYVLKIRRYHDCWEHYPEFKPENVPPSVKISVIVAFRNEIAHLENLSSALYSQVYPPGAFEVIFVNDHSIDGSDILARQICDKYQNFRLIHNSVDRHGKKHALMQGIIYASYELIVTTDADCTLHDHWLAAFAGIYQQKTPDMMVGLVEMIPGDSFLERFQATEFLSLVAAGAGATAGGHPLYCNGACLAFRKSSFLQFNDPMKLHISSGEDTFFLHELKRVRGSSIVLVKAVPAIAATRGVSTWREFFQQRKRWSSKTLYYRDPDTIYTAMLVFLVSLAMLYAMYLFVSGRNFWLFPVMYLVKAMTDLSFIKDFLRFYRRTVPVLQFMLYELLYPAYAVFLALAGISSGHVWKGRKYKPNFPIPT